METPEPAACIGDPRKAALRAGRGPHTRHETVLFALLVPGAVYLASVWIVRPVPFAYVTPALLLLGALAIKIPRRLFTESLARLKVEFALLTLMLFLSILSLANSSEPLRAFRVIYPCVLPLVLASYLVAVGCVSRGWLLAIPRALIAMGVIFSLLPFLASFLLAPLEEYLFGSYRLHGFFENSIQHAIALSTMVPLLVAEITIKKERRARLACIAILIVLAYTLFRSGSKTAMFFSLLSALSIYVVIRIRSQSASRSIMMALVIAMAIGFLSLFGLQIATALNPTIGEKLRQIVEGGVTNYQSVESRELLWREALRMGEAHWLIGAGAGRTVLGISHSHNLVLDYFKGIGLFGAMAVFALCVMIIGRAAVKAASVLKGGSSDTDRRILACYVSAAVYVILNQMSDCFGPSTIGFLWILYLSGVLADRRSSLRVPRRIARPAVPSG